MGRILWWVSPRRRATPVLAGAITLDVPRPRCSRQSRQNQTLVPAFAPSPEQPDDIFKGSVLQRSDGDHNLFVLTDQVAVEQAVHQGATRITETDLVVLL